MTECMECGSRHNLGSEHIPPVPKPPPPDRPLMRDKHIRKGNNPLDDNPIGSQPIGSEPVITAPWLFLEEHYDDLPEDEKIAFHKYIHDTSGVLQSEGSKHSPSYLIATIIGSLAIALMFQ